MQSISPLAVSDFQLPVKKLLYKFEVYDGASWIDLCSLNSKNYLKSPVSFSSGDAGASSEPAAGVWSAIVSNKDGIFHPRHPTSAYVDLLRVGRKVRIWVGGKINGTAYYWQRLIGYMDAPRFDVGKATVELSGCDYAKALADTILHSGNDHWGAVETFNSVSSPSGSGAEMYDEADACEIGAHEANNVTNWASGGSGIASSVASTKSNYALQLERESDGPTPEYCHNSNVGAITDAKQYRVKFWGRVAVGDTAGYLMIYSTVEGNPHFLTQIPIAVNGNEWTYYSAIVTVVATGAMQMRLHSSNKDALEGDKFQVDEISIQEYSTGSWNRYDMPAACNGPYFVTLDGEPIWQGDTAARNDWEDGARNISWHYDESEGVRAFYFNEDAQINAGTDNLLVYYYTDQVPENVVADILVIAGLYADQAAALAAMTYAPTGITIPRVWFEAGTSALAAIQAVCERCNYRFWFSPLGVPIFLPPPTIGDAVASFGTHRVSSLSDFQDLGEIRNRVTIEGIDQAMYQTNSSIGSTRLKGEAFDQDSIDANLEHTHAIRNDLFQDQASIDAMDAILIAAYKDPKWYTELHFPYNPIPLELGDTINWDIIMASGLKVEAAGFIRDIQFSEKGFTYKCEMESGIMNIANYTTTPVAVTAEHCKNWCLTNAGAGADVHFDLPAAVVGMRIRFFVLAAQTITVDPNGTDRIAVLTGTAGDYLRSDAVIGSYIDLACLVAGYWHKQDIAGTWTEE